MTDAKKDLRIVFLVSLCLIAVTIGTYIQVINFDFVGFDDELYVTKNLLVQKGVSLEGLKWAFTTFHAANWHPLTWLSHMLDCELFGLDPLGHHWTNVVFHIANTLLLFIILFKMTGALWKSAIVAALFSLHPLHVESVAWVSERKDVLSTLMFLLSLAVYYRYVKNLSFKTYLLVIICFSLGLMAKPMLVTLPFVLLLLDFWPLNRFKYTNSSVLQSDNTSKDGFKGIYWIIFEKIPLFIPVLISCTLTFFAQKSEGAVLTIEVLTIKCRIENALVSYINYVLKMIWPIKLTIFYPHPRYTLPAWQIFGASLLITSACLWAIRVAKKYPYIAVGLFWYLGTLVPVIGLIQVGEQAMADRYTYIPLIGLFIIVVWGASDLLKKWYYQRLFFYVFVPVMLIALSWTTFLQLRYWKNGITLFEHALEINKNSSMAHNNLATALGSTNFDRAVYHYKEAVRIHPKYVTALCNLGLTLYQKGDYEQAASYYSKALEIDPQKVDTRMDLANIFFLQGNPEKAISQYREILKTDYENADAHYNLACMLAAKKKIDQAKFHYMEALRINPNHEKAHYNLGNIYFKQRKTTEAFMHYAEVIKIKPDYVQAYNKLGLILYRQGKFSKAKVLFSKALEIDHNYSEARKNIKIVQKKLLTDGQ
jgi:protein O-mannosyl-transferase